MAASSSSPSSDDAAGKLDGRAIFDEIMNDQELREFLDKYRPILSDQTTVYDQYRKDDEYGNPEEPTTLQRNIRMGAFAVIVPAIGRDMGGDHQIALKVIDLTHGGRLLKEQLPIYLEREVETLKLAQAHDNLLHMYEFKQTSKFLVIAIEWLDQEIFNYFSDYEDEFPEEAVREMTAQVMNGLRFLHQNQIVHRDLHPRNVMVRLPRRPDQQPIFKIIDFGMSRVLPDTTTNLTMFDIEKLGFRIYRDPFCLKGQGDGAYDLSCDLFSFGVLLFTLTQNNEPWNWSERGTLEDRINLAFCNAWNGSTSGQYFVQTLLQAKMEERLKSAADVFTNNFWLEWMSANVEDWWMKRTRK